MYKRPKPEKKAPEVETALATPSAPNPVAPENTPLSFPFAPFAMPGINLPAEMREAARWVVWAFWWGNGRWKKEPRSHLRLKNAKNINGPAKG